MSTQSLGSQHVNDVDNCSKLDEVGEFNREKTPFEKRIIITSTPPQNFPKNHTTNQSVILPSHNQWFPYSQTSINNSFKLPSNNFSQIFKPIPTYSADIPTDKPSS